VANVSVPTAFAAVTTADTVDLDADFQALVDFINNPLNRGNYAADIGTVNAYIVNPTPALTNTNAGQLITWTPANTCTGASTVNFSSLGALPIKKLSAGALADTASGDIASGVACVTMTNGASNVVLVNPSDAVAATVTTLGTPTATTSGTSITFSGIPAGTKYISMSLVGVSTNGSSPAIVQLGAAGGVENTGYLSAGANGAIAANFTNGFGLQNSAAPGSLHHGTVHFNLENSTNFTWSASGILALSNSATVYTSAGAKSLSSELTTVVLTTSGGTDAFDAGQVNIAYHS